MDEAHNCAPAGRGKYATDSLRTQAPRVLVPHFEHKLFLTVTPLNGYPESFTALLERLDNQRFAPGTPPERKQLEAVMVRRLKSEPPPKWDGSPRFPKRMLEPLEVAYTDEEQAIHAALRRYSQLRQARADDNAEKFATELSKSSGKQFTRHSPLATRPGVRFPRDEARAALHQQRSGPAEGPDEELTERNVRDRYLVGILAPRRQPGRPHLDPHPLARPRLRWRRAR